jgi:hypothetical protein
MEHVEWQCISNVALRASLVQRVDVKNRPCRSTTILTRASLLDQVISDTSLQTLGQFLQLFPVILRMVHIPLTPKILQNPKWVGGIVKF